MRYIDADKLQEEFKELHCGKRSLLIDTEPTADVRENVQLDVCPLYGGVCGYPSGECYDCPRHGNFRENVKGEWLHDEVTMNGNTVYTPNAKCSICDCYVFQESDFCPNCGADMRGE